MAAAAASNNFRLNEYSNPRWGIRRMGSDICEEIIEGINYKILQPTRILRTSKTMRYIWAYFPLLSVFYYYKILYNFVINIKNIINICYYTIRKILSMLIRYLINTYEGLLESQEIWTYFRFLYFVCYTIMQYIICSYYTIYILLHACYISHYY